VEEVKTALRTIRFKLLQGAGGTHEEFILRKIFTEFDSEKRGKLNAENLLAMLVKL
jgi:DNA polymerase/3'-5' exonuclease PolX